MLRHIDRWLLSSILSILLYSCVAERVEHCPTMEQIGFTPSAETLRSTEAATVAKQEECIDIIPLQSDDPNAPQLYLHIYESDLVATEFTTDPLRAAPLTTAGLSSIGSYAYTYLHNETFDTSSSRQIFMDNLEVTRASGWNSGLYWPGASRRISFFSYAPYNATGVTFNGSPSSDPSFHYSTPTSIADQKDIVVATAKDIAGDYGQPVSLSFQHILAAIRFKVGDSGILPGTITHIHLKNVYSEATYNLNTASWSAQASMPPDNAFTLDEEITLSGEAGQQIGSEKHTFMMIPQRFEASNNKSKIAVGYKDVLTGEEHALVASLGAQEWKQGKIRTYKVSLSSIYAENVLQVYDEKTQDYSSTAYTTRSRPASPATHIDIPIKIKSYTKIVSPKGTVYKPVEWKSEFSLDGGVSWNTTTPYWLENLPLTGSGTNSEDDIEQGNARILLRDSVYVGDWMLQQATPVSGSVDLSEGHRDGTGRVMARTTANCYLVHAPGTYRFPIVYGNAYRDGVANAVAYTPSMFKDGLDNIISSPGIPNAHHVELLWDDACEPDGQHIARPQVQDVQIVPHASGDPYGQDYVQFTISPDIRQGNAVIAVRDAANKIIWSWHIWVTPYRSGYDPQVGGLHPTSERDVENNGNRYRLWNYVLGQYDRGLSYPELYIIVRLTQKNAIGTPKVAYLYIRKLEHVTNPDVIDYACLYQWGRKDPFSIKYYKWIKNSNRVTETMGGPVSLFEAASKPTTFVTRFTTIDTWNDWVSEYYKLWNSSSEGRGHSYDIGTKSVYDPSPVGYMMPPDGLWRGIESEAWGYGHQTIGLIKCTDASFDKLGVEGSYWYSTSLWSRQAHSFYKEASRIVSSSKAMAYGFGVRPIREE